MNKTVVAETEFEKHLNARQRRQQVGRLRGLNQRVNSVPLFSEEMRERELAARPEYFEAAPTDHDLRVTALKIAMKKGPVDFRNFFEEDYERSGIVFSYMAMAYKDFAESVLPFIDFIKLDVRASKYFRYGPHYRADIYHSALFEIGFRKQTWEILARFSDDPAEKMAFFEKYLNNGYGKASFII